MSYTQVLSGLDMLQERKEMSEYIKNFDGNGGFMYTIETDPIKIELKNDMETLLDDGSHSGSSWGWMMRVIQAVLRGDITIEEIIELDIKQKQEYRVRAEEYRITAEEYRVREELQHELQRLENEEDRIACVLKSEEKVNTSGEVQLKDVPLAKEEEPNVVEKPNVVKEVDCVAKDKPYRACIYDIYDEKYATLLKSMNYPEEFNTFTQGLMDEQSINRGSLLSAIDDYHNSKSGPRLSEAFKNNAFNYRPYQTW